MMDLESLGAEIGRLRSEVSQLRVNTSKAEELEYGQPAGIAWILNNCIFIYKGAVADIPEGWHLCDGQEGTIDLRDKFIVGAGSTYAVGATGGSATQADHPALSHDNNHVGSAVNAHLSHDHNARAVYGPQNPPAAAGVYFWQGGSGSDVNNTTLGPNQTMSHVVTQPSAHSNHAAQSHGTNLPPYYAFALIQKVHGVE